LTFLLVNTNISEITACSILTIGKHSDRERFTVWRLTLIKIYRVKTSTLVRKDSF